MANRVIFLISTFVLTLFGLAWGVQPPIRTAIQQDRSSSRPGGNATEPGRGMGERGSSGDPFRGGIGGSGGSGEQRGSGQGMRGGGMRGGGMGGGWGAPRAQRSDFPMWEIEPAFQHDTFTFVRIQYDSQGRRGQTWENDFPDCDWNFSLRLQQLTTLRVDPNGKVLRLSDPDLFNHPFIFMTNSDSVILDDVEQKSLRRYLLEGGFMMVDDIWAPNAWRHMRHVMKTVFPEREPRELTIEHELFHTVYDIAKLPQVPSIRAWLNGDHFEYWHGDPEGDEDPHFWAYFDDHGRMMAIVCHNNDIADGWEREGENAEYFEQYSMKCSYPFGINLITYIMSH